MFLALSFFLHSPLSKINKIFFKNVLHWLGILNFPPQISNRSLDAAGNPATFPLVGSLPYCPKWLFHMFLSINLQSLSLNNCATKMQHSYHRLPNSKFNNVTAVCFPYCQNKSFLACKVQPFLSLMDPIPSYFICNYPLSYIIIFLSLETHAHQHTNIPL